MIKSSIYLLSRLQNKEFPIAYKQIVMHLQKEEFTVDDVKQSFAIMQERNRALDLMRNQRTAHPLSEKIAELRDLRHKSLISLKGRITYASKSGIPEEQRAGSRLKFWLNTYGKDYKKRSIHVQSQVVYGMKDDISQTPEINAALKTLNLTATMAHLTSISVELDACIKDREQEDLAYKKKNKQLREEAYKALKVFVTTLEIALFLGKGNKEDHLACLRTVDFVLSDFKSTYLARATRRKNKALKQEEAQQEKEIITSNNVDEQSHKKEEPEIVEVVMSNNKSKFDLVPQVTDTLPETTVKEEPLKDDDAFGGNDEMAVAGFAESDNKHELLTLTHVKELVGMNCPNQSTAPKRSLNKEVLSKAALHKKLKYSASSSVDAKDKPIVSVAKES